MYFQAANYAIDDGCQVDLDTVKKVLFYDTDLESKDKGKCIYANWALTINIHETFVHTVQCLILNNTK